MSGFSSTSSDSEPLVTETTKESISTAQPQKKRLRSVISISNSESHLSRLGSLGSGNIVHTPSPPQSVPALVKDAYTSPDRLHLREALICGGGHGETEINAVEKCTY